MPMFAHAHMHTQTHIHSVSEIHITDWVRSMQKRIYVNMGL